MSAFLTRHISEPITEPVYEPDYRKGGKEKGNRILRSTTYGVDALKNRGHKMIIRTTDRKG